MNAAWLATIACLALLLALLAAERSGARTGRYATKPLASLAFIAVALFSPAREDAYAQWVLAGLALGAVGDVALMFEGNKPFLAGLIAFLLGHLAYVVAFLAVQPVANWTLLILPVPIVGAALVYRWLWPHLGRMRVPVLAYTAVITAMALAGLSLAIHEQASALPPRQALLATAGAVLFFLSDLAVAREKFVARGFINRAWGLPAYYVGQLLIAWSVLLPT